ncbi:MAG: lipoate--protein ligase family protein [Candidatus Stahlbacteria bacterium]|nr:lipoate--protein ligase family protein [Candidatus Stahlbacteria bacterium]
MNLRPSDYQTIRLIESPPANASYNMAVDEALLLLHTANRKPNTANRIISELPILRFYTFSPPAITIGRFQKVENMELYNGINVVRRITGGRAILHDGDITYSLVIEVNHPFLSGNPLEGYKKISLLFIDALNSLGVEAQLIRINRNPQTANRKPQTAKNPGCFSSVSRYELQVQGKKVLGSAQKRQNGVILQQGSLMINSKSSRHSGIPKKAGQPPIPNWNQIGLSEILGRKIEIEEILISIKKVIKNMGIKIVNSTITEQEKELTNTLIPHYSIGNPEESRV